LRNHLHILLCKPQQLAGLAISRGQELLFVIVDLENFQQPR